MGQVEQATVCPKCGSIDSYVEGICKKCGYNKHVYENKHIKYVNYVTLQAADGLTRDLFKKEEHKEKEAKRQAVIDAAHDYFRNAQPLQITASLQDAKSFMEYLLHSKADKDTIKSSITLAKKIGELGTALHNYFMAGGKIGETAKEKEGDSMETNEAFKT